MPAGGDYRRIQFFFDCCAGLRLVVVHGKPDVSNELFFRVGLAKQHALRETEMSSDLTMLASKADHRTAMPTVRTFLARLHQCFGSS